MTEMNRKRIDQRKNPRSIQQKRNQEGCANIVDNRLDGHRNYLSGAPLQRVVQREGEANGKFIYVADISETKDRIPFNYHTIHFTDYTDGVILSAGFSGCFMMAFHFRQLDGALFQGGQVPENIGMGPFVAHVSNDEKRALFDAERRQLITIDAIFRPSNKETTLLNPRKREYQNELSDGQAAIRDITGGMLHTDAGWEGMALSQEKVPTFGPFLPQQQPDYQWSNPLLLRWYSVADMRTRTQASKAYLYALVIDEISKKHKDDRFDPNEMLEMETAIRGLQGIRQENPDALGLACDELVNDISEGDVKNILQDLASRH